MAFIVEDGTGLSNSTSYTSVQEWKNYWVDRGFDFSAYTDPEIEVALIRATDYIEQQYRNRFVGQVEDPAQALSWPRTGVYVHCVALTGVPVNIKRATFEYAKRAIPEDAQLLPEPADTDITGQVIGVTKVKVGPIEKETTYASMGALTSRSYPAADKWLTDLIYSGEGVIRN